MLTMLTMLTHFWHTAEKNIAWSRFWCIWSRFVFELVKLLQEVTLERWTQQITQINFKHQHINCTNLKWNDYRHKFNLWKRHFLWFFPSCCISQGCRKGVAKVIFFHHCDFKSVPMLYTGLANSKFSCTNQILRHVEFQICITLPPRRLSETGRNQNSFIPTKETAAAALTNLLRTLTFFGSRKTEE